MAPILKGFKSLLRLDIRSLLCVHVVEANRLGAEGARVLAPSLKELNALSTLFISKPRLHYTGGNNFGADGAIALAPAIQELKALTTLSISMANNFIIIRG